MVESYEEMLADIVFDLLAGKENFCMNYRKAFLAGMYE